jgi:hypothetical protein
MTGPHSTLEATVHRAILEVIEDPSLKNLNLEGICAAEPKYFQFFGLRKETERRKLVRYQKKNYITRKSKNPKNYARACIKFGVEVDQDINPILFEWIETLKAEADQDATEAETEMLSSTKKRTPNRPIKRGDDEDYEDDVSATVGFNDFFDGKKKLA